MYLPHELFHKMTPLRILPITRHPLIQRALGDNPDPDLQTPPLNRNPNRDADIQALIKGGGLLIGGLHYPSFNG